MIVGSFNSVSMLIALDSYQGKDEKVKYLENIKSDIERIINCFEETKTLPLKTFTSITSEMDGCEELMNFIKIQFKSKTSNRHDQNDPGEGKIKGLLRTELSNYQKLQAVIEDEIISVKRGKIVIEEEIIEPEPPKLKNRPKLEKSSKRKESHRKRESSKQKERPKEKESTKLKGNTSREEDTQKEENRIIQEHHKLKEEHKLEEERKLKEEQKIEEKRKQDERRRLEEEHNQEENRRFEEEKQRLEEEKRRLEEGKRRLVEERELDEKRRLEEEHKLDEKRKLVEEHRVEENSNSEEYQLLKAVTSREKREKKKSNFIMFESYSPQIIAKLLNEFKGDKIVWFSSDRKLIELVKKTATLKLIDQLDENSLPNFIVKNFVNGDKKNYTISEIEKVYKTL